MKNSKSLLPLVFWLVIPQLFGIVGAIFTAFSVTTWFPTLVKSPLNPPSWVFSPVWTTLYILMGLAAYLVWSKKKSDGFPTSALSLLGNDRRIALIIFFGQLVLNTLWSVVFFGLRKPGWALVEIFVLWLAIIVTIISFNKISKLAALLLIPYLLWVSFAMILNYSIWQLNPNIAQGNQKPCTLEAKICPDGTSVGRTGPNCEFEACPTEPLQEQGIKIPINYTLDSYKIEKVLDQTCRTNDDCRLPFEYGIRSNCPYVAPCLKNKCTVVCPSYK